MFASFDRGDGMKKSIEPKYIYRGVCAIILILIATGLFSLVWIPFVKDHNQTGHLLGMGNVGMAILIYMLLFIIIGRGLHAFKIGVERASAIMASEALTVAVVDVSEIFISLAITGQWRFFGDFAWRYLLLCVVQMALLCLIVIPMIQIYRKKFPPLQLLEIYGDHKHGLHHKLNELAYKYHVAEMVHFSINEDELKEKIQNYDAVLISDIPSHFKNKALKICVDLDKRFYMVPKISDVIVKYTEELNLIDTPLFLCKKIGIGYTEGIIKRFFDVLLSALALVLLSPVFLVTAIAIKMEDRGPVFYRQERCTIGGNHFSILKFRSMIVDAEKDGRPHPAGEKDDRITKVGNIIRATRIDELPQLLNILKGDMSIVGPRPERVEHVEKYTEDIPEFSFRSKVKGGLTGYAQVYGKYNTTALDKLKLDLIYIMNYSLLLDIQIIFETVKILFRKESTEGFSEERVAEMHGEDTDEHSY